MFQNIKNFFLLTLFFIFAFFVMKYYISEKNIISTGKSRSSYSLDTNSNLTLLKNDTDNIIVYKNDVEEFKKKRKKRFWEKLISDNDE